MKRRVPRAVNAQSHIGATIGTLSGNMQFRSGLGHIDTGQTASKIGGC